jgi:hypothetical protein
MRRWLAIILLALVGRDLQAQGVPGTNVQVEVRVVAVATRADTTRVTYVVASGSGSLEEVVNFMVDAPGGVVRIEMPGPQEDWLLFDRHWGWRPVARWVILGGLPPGGVTPPLTYEAIGLPAVVRAWAAGRVEVPTVDEDDPHATAILDSLLTVDPIIGKSQELRVLGVVPVPPSITPLDLARRLVAQRDEACLLHWVDLNGICNSLDAKLDAAVRALTRGDMTAARGELDAFLNELEAQRGQHLTEAAYFLLRINADYLRARL